MIGNPGVNPTERLFTPQTVCVPASGVYIARAVTQSPSIPGTKAEVIALAADCGVTDWQTVGRFNFTKLAAGMKKRYGLVGTVVEGATAAVAAVKAQWGKGPSVIGLAGDQLKLTPHWQGASIGHAIAVMYPFAPGSSDMGIQLDPLAPANYRGDAFGEAELVAFCTAAIIFPVPEEVTTLRLKIKAAQAALA